MPLLALCLTNYLKFLKIKPHEKNSNFKNSFINIYI